MEERIKQLEERVAQLEKPRRLVAGGTTTKIINNNEEFVEKLANAMSKAITDSLANYDKLPKLS